TYDTNGSYNRLDWSPDGKKVAFVKGFNSSNFDLFIMNIDGSNLSRLTYNKIIVTKPLWSKNGNKIVFSSRTTDNYQYFIIYSINSDGTNERQLTNDGDALDIGLSPTEEKIIFTKGNNRYDEYDLY